MTDVFEPVRQARRLWEQSQPQTFIDFEELPDAGTTAPAESPLAGTRPAAPVNTNGSGHAHPESAREAGASQETS